jgi:outer membrane lipoprotein SlyB
VGPHPQFGLFQAALALGALAALGGCARVERPVLFPNAQYQRVGKAAAEQAVDACMRVAPAGGGGPAARHTASGALVGGAAGAATGSFSGAAGRGLVVGTAAGSAAGLIGAALTPDPPSLGHQALVRRCLSEQGFEVVGWR